MKQIDVINPSPAGILAKIGQFILGKERPDGLTRFFFYFNLILWSAFFFWSISSYFSFAFIENIRKVEEMHVVVDEIGSSLGIVDLFERYKDFQLDMIFVWIAVLFGLILLWRKKQSYFYFYFGGLLLFPLLMLWFFNWSYMVSELSLFDKTCYMLLFVPTLVYQVLFKKEKDSDVQHVHEV